MRLDYVAEQDDEETFLPEKKKESRKGLYFVCFTTITIIIVLSVFFALKEEDNKNNTGVPQISEQIKANDIMEHLNALYMITQSNPVYRGSRSVLNAYNISAEYILKQLDNITNNYILSTESLLVPVWQQNTNPTMIQYTPTDSITFINTVDFRTVRDGGNGTFDFDAPIVEIPNYGCEADDFNPIHGRENEVICVIRDLGPCAPLLTSDYSVKAQNAQNAGCLAGIVYRDPDTPTLSNVRVRKYGWTYGMFINQIPFFSITYSTYQILNTYKNYNLRIVQNCTSVLASTYNVYAESKTGDPEQIVIVGAHLDSVAEGPGLNDNGSGSSLILELALLFSQYLPNPRNKLRFHWWAAEEIGSLGAFHFVNYTQQRENILCNLNFDMMGSPNGIIQINNASKYPEDKDITQETIIRSLKIMSYFIQHYQKKGIVFTDTDMTGGSDYYPFFVSNIPAGGLATGASEIKSIDDRTKYGGWAGAWLDPCYHQSCDTPDNIDVNLLQLLAEAAADVVQQFATNQDPFGDTDTK